MSIVTQPTGHAGDAGDAGDAGAGGGVGVGVVVGIDTHRDTHELAMLTAAGVAVADCRVANSSSGFAEAMAWIGDQAGGQPVLVGVEGSRSYGLALTRALAAAGLRVAEITGTRRPRPQRGKTDRIDAHAIALTALATPADRLAVPRADGDRDALRLLLTARRDLTHTATAATNRVKDLLRGGDDTDRDLARRDLGVAVLDHLTRRRGHASETRYQSLRRREITRLARTLRTLRSQLAENKTTLAEIVDDLAADLTTRIGIGPITAAHALTTWSHPGRVRDDAAFAALAGVCPIPASSGQTTRWRLNRGGDRTLNHAIHTIALTRWAHCPRTHAYITRRRAEGKTDRDIRRCLKRYIARELHRTLTHTMT